MRGFELKWRIVSASCKFIFSIFAFKGFFFNQNDLISITISSGWR